MGHFKSGIHLVLITVEKFGHSRLLDFTFVEPETSEEDSGFTSGMFGPFADDGDVSALDLIILVECLIVGGDVFGVIGITKELGPCCIVRCVDGKPSHRAGLATRGAAAVLHGDFKFFVLSKGDRGRRNEYSLPFSKEFRVASKAIMTITYRSYGVECASDLISKDVGEIDFFFGSICFDLMQAEGREHGASLGESRDVFSLGNNSNPEGGEILRCSSKIVSGIRGESSRGVDLSTRVGSQFSVGAFGIGVFQRFPGFGGE